MRRVVGVTTVVFWTSGTLVVVLVVLSWVAPGLREERFFLVLGGAAAGMAMVTSAYLFWYERRTDRQELRAARQESRDIPAEGDGELLPKTWFYLIAFFLSFVLSSFLLPHLLLS
jgi:hypothetical protein